MQGFKSWREKNIFPYPKPTTTALRPTQPHIQRTLQILSSGKSSHGIRLPTYLHLVPRVGMSGARSSLHLYDFTACKGTTCQNFFDCDEIPSNQIIPSKKSTQLWTITSEHKSETVFMKSGMYTVPMEYTQMYFSISRY